MKAGKPVSSFSCTTATMRRFNILPAYSLINCSFNMKPGESHFSILTSRFVTTGSTPLMMTTAMTRMLELMKSGKVDRLFAKKLFKSEKKKIFSMRMPVHAKARKRMFKNMPRLRRMYSRTLSFLVLFAFISAILSSSSSTLKLSVTNWERSSLPFSVLMVKSHALKHSLAYRIGFFSFSIKSRLFFSLSSLIYLYSDATKMMKKVAKHTAA
mmetsp:Transcript_47531/g.123071  ORF Transcript_47531/g.123071 Transcript_47531/m.123071 type:complete len:212 (-) Transcript_47531:1276-1911(-)